jgi:adenosylmethionine-8-amino-7-oxononanoate aminotransferase
MPLTSRDRLWLPSTDRGTFEPSVHVCLRAGEGVWAEADDGTRYFDANAGLWHLSLGYSPRPAVDAATSAGRRLGGTSLLRRAHTWAFALVDAITECLRGWEPVMFFATSGSEAVDTALRIAIAYHDDPDRRSVGFISGGYHGASLGPLALSVSDRYRNGSPQALDAIVFPSVEEWRVDPAAVLRRVNDVFGAQGPRMAAVIAEPIQCVGGMTVVPAEYLHALARGARDRDCLFIADEVSTGVHRTGPFLASQEVGCYPDLVVMGKGLTAGLSPLGVVAVDARIASKVRSGARTSRIPGFTQAATPGACAAAIATLEHLQTNAGARGQTADLLQRSLAPLADLSHVETVEGRGHAHGIRIVASLGLDDPGFITRATQAGLRHGLLLHPLSSGVVPVMPALTIGPDEVELLAQRLGDALMSLAQKAPPP